VFEESDTIVPDFDPHFKIFHELMAFKVMNILLVSSPYDAFIMEEDGSIATRVIREYQGLNLSGAPRVTRVSSGQEAIKQIKNKRFDLVITMPFMSGTNAFDLGLAIKKIKPNLTVILIVHNIRAISPLSSKCDNSGIDNIFLWCCGSELLVALVKNVEDHVNAVADTKRAMVRVIIYIEDSPVDRSFFLPQIYKEVVRQTQSVLDESLNEKHRLLRMRARPKILMATDYEHALSFYESFRPYVFGIISDARFPRECTMDRDAGIRFLTHVREQVHDLPLLLLSSETENRAKAESIPAVYINKSSPFVVDELRSFFIDHLGFGDFVFRLPDKTEICRANTIREFEEKLNVIPEESLRYHAGRNHFSNWVMARSEIVLARRLHKEYISRIKRIEDMRADLVFKVHALRRLRQQGIVARFSIDDYDGEIMDFVKIGDGSVGGKARGLAFMWAMNRKLSSAGRSYLLIGPGRWGSADPWLGIPVQWGDISAVGAIIEIYSDLIRADASQGRHFFQNITSLGIPYLTVNGRKIKERVAGLAEDDYLDWKWLLAVSPENDGVYVRHVRLPQPFVMICNGKKPESVIYVSRPVAG